MTSTRLLLFLICLVILSPRGLFAHYDYKFDQTEVKSGQFESEITAKLERGITNILFGWTEAFRVPVDLSGDPEHGKIQAFTLGIPYGLLRGVGRTGVGVYEVLTCYVPQQPIFYPIQGDVL
jgi:putative exosortase-associated protein (TIGR04073 family)